VHQEGLTPVCFFCYAAYPDEMRVRRLLSREPGRNAILAVARLLGPSSAAPLIIADSGCIFGGTMVPDIRNETRRGGPLVFG
jgi:hypothetical protein